MLVKTDRFVHQWVAWASAEIFQAMAISTFCSSYSGCWQTDVNKKFYPFYTTKHSPWKHALQSHSFKNHIQVDVYTSVPKRCTFRHTLQVLLKWRIIQYRYHCKLQTTESELTSNIHNYVWRAIRVKWILAGPSEQQWDRGGAAVWQGWDRGGAAVGQQKRCAQWKLTKSKKSLLVMLCFRSGTMLTSDIITKIIENRSESSGFTNGCNKFVLTMKWPMILLWKGTDAPVYPLWKGRGGNAPLYSATLRCPCSFVCAGWTSLLSV